MRQKSETTKRPASVPLEKYLAVAAVVTVAAVAEDEDVETTVGNVDELLGVMREDSAHCVKGVDPHSKFFRTPVPPLLSLAGPKPIKSNSWQNGELETLLLFAARNDGGV